MAKKKRCYRTINGYGTKFCCNGRKVKGSRVKLTCRNLAKRKRKKPVYPSFSPGGGGGLPAASARPYSRPVQTELFSSSPSSWAPPSEIERARAELLEQDWGRAATLAGFRRRYSRRSRW